MQKTIHILLILFIIITLTNCASKPIKQIKDTKIKPLKPIDQKMRIGIVSFGNKTKNGEKLGSAAADILIKELSKTNRYIIVEREKLEKLIKEKRLRVDGINDLDSVTYLGKALDINAIIIGSITQFGIRTQESDYPETNNQTQIAEAAVEIYLIDTDADKVMYVDSGKGIAKASFKDILDLGANAGYDKTVEGGALQNALLRFIDKIVFNMDKKIKACRVVDIRQDSGEIFINVGRASGIISGLTVIIFNPRAEIRDSITGKVIGYDEIPVAKIKVERLFGEDGSVGKVLNGELPSINDICGLAD